MIKFTSVPTKRLATALTPSSTTMQLTDIEGWDGNDLTSADFGTTLYAVLRTDDNSAIEIMELDPTTIASSAITISKRGLKFTGDLTTQVTANKLTWLTTNTNVELGTDSPQMLETIKEYIDGVSIAGASDASTTTKGIVEEATTAEIDAGTQAGGTSAELFVNPNKLSLSKYARGTNYQTYAADGGSTDDYEITVVPAPTSYVTGDVYTFKANTKNTGPVTLNVNSLGAKAIVKNGTTPLSTGDIIAGQFVTVVYNGTSFQALSSLVGQGRFGGTGADGALTATSGTTTIDLGGARLFIKNYSSISITGTGAIAFSNPHANGTIIVFKCAGDLTVTSSATRAFDLRLLGGTGGTAPSGNGSNGTSLFGPWPTGGSGGSDWANTTNSGGVAANLAYMARGGMGAKVAISGRVPLVFTGAGGGGGSAHAQTAGAGGRGGGGIYFEVGGNINLTGTFDVSGAVGSNGSGTTGSGSGGSGGQGGGGVNSADLPTYASQAAGDGGGGGGGGSVVIIYGGAVTANSATFTIAGGTGGEKGGGGVVGSSGADGYSYVAANTDLL